MKLYAFTLSMPGRGSWDGAWSGEGKLYVVVRQIYKHQLTPMPHYRYPFGDAWVAHIDVKQVNAKEAARLRRKSAGFQGYEWMVDSIINQDKILPPSRADDGKEPSDG